MDVHLSACLRSKVACLAIALFCISGLTYTQDSFMMAFYPSGPGVGGINRGDFNNDGILDVITGNNGGNSGYGVSVNLGKGDGFQPARNSAPGMGTFDMAIGDFNGDGKLDVALAGYVNAGHSANYAGKR